MKKFKNILVAVLILGILASAAEGGELVAPSLIISSSATSSMIATPTSTISPEEIPIIDVKMPGDFTKLEITPPNGNLRLQTGESKEMTVTVKNRDNKTVSSKPKIINPPYGGPVLDKDWIEIIPASAEIAAGSSQVFKLKVSIPQDAIVGYYNTMIAFTEEVFPTPYPEPMPPYAHTFSLYIDVWTQPKIRISPMYINDQLEAMKEYDYEIKLTNIANKEININPSVGSEGYVGPYGMPPAIPDSAISIRGPRSVQANATETVHVHVRVPDTYGYYNGYINMGIDDTSMPDGGRVNLNFNVWKQPTEPFIKKFNLEKDSPITIEISSNTYGMYPARKDIKPSFETLLGGPDGISNLKPSKKVMKGTINLGGDIPPWEIDGKNLYQETGTQYIETYTVKGKEGKYMLSMMPKNAPTFEYSITIGGN